MDEKESVMSIGEAIQKLNEDEYIDVSPVTKDSILAAIDDVEKGKVVKVSSIEEMFKNIGWWYKWNIALYTLNNMRKVC